MIPSFIIHHSSFIIKRVLHINSSRDLRGGERQTRLLIDGLARRGWENYLVSRADSPFSKTNGLLIKGLFPLKMRGEFDLIAGFQIGKIARDYHIPLIHCHTALAHSLGIYAQLVCGAKLVVTRRVDFNLRGGAASLWKYNRSDHIIAISRRIQQILLDSGIPSRKISLIPSGVRFPQLPESSVIEKLRAELNLPPEAIVIGTVAALAGHKDYPTLLRAFRQVAEVYPQAILLALGEGDERPRLESLIQELNLTEKVRLLGFREDVNTFFHIFQIYVQSSKKEGLCTSLIEAMHYGLPIAATSAGGIPDLIEDGVTGLITPPEDHSALAASIIKLLGDGKTAGKYGEASRLKSQNFSADIMVERNEQVYLKLLEAANA